MHAAMRAMSALRRFLQGREPGQHRLVVPPNRHTCLRATDPWRWSALPKGGLLGGYVDVCVPIRGGEVDVAEPAADHVDLDAGLEEMDSCRVAKNVGTDPAGTRSRSRRQSKWSSAMAATSRARSPYVTRSKSIA
jgi:hypothetical protein